MIEKLTAMLAAALLATASTSVFAQGTDELWEVTTKMEMAGMPSMPAQTTQVCKNKGDRDPSKMAQDKDSDCKMTDLKQAGNKSSWKMVCTKPEPMTGSGEVTYSGDSYRGTMTMKGRDMDLTQTMSGKKVGNCTYEDPAKKVAAMQAQSTAAIAKECDNQIESLNTLMVFGGQNLPQEAVLCRDRKTDFCARSAKLSQQMRDPAGFAEMARKYPHWRDAVTACGSDPASVAGPACKSAIDGKNWSFVAEQCPSESRTLAQQHCIGLDYTSAMASPYKEVCMKYAAELAKGKMVGEKAVGGSAVTPPQPPAAATKPSVNDAVKEGAKSLKKLLKF